MSVITPDNILQEIESCSDLSIILKSRYGEEYVESYNLPFILKAGDKFWGKFQNVHAVDKSMGVPVPGVGAYLYNNFSDVVCCSYFQQKMERYYSLKAYSHAEFKCRSKYKKIFDSRNKSSIDELREYVLAGKKLKAKITDHHEYTYILKLHTVEVYKNKIFAECEFDGVPEKVRYFQFIEDLNVQFEQMESSYVAPNYPATHYVNSAFYLTNFLYESGNNTLIRRFYTPEGELSGEQLDFNEYEIWGEV